MALEHAHLNVRRGDETAFEEAFDRAKATISASPGFLSLRLGRSLEQPGRYLLLVEWRSLHDDTVGFRGSPPYGEWRQMLHHFYDPFPEVEHFEVATTVP